MAQLTVEQERALAVARARRRRESEARSPAEPPSRLETALDVISQTPGLGFLGREARGYAGEVGRQGGLAARYIVEGATMLPAMAADVVGGVANAGLEAAGSDTRFGSTQNAISDILTRVGLPQPRNALERVVGDASRAVSAGGGVISAAQRASRPALAAIQGARSQAPNPIANMLTQAPGVQAAGEAVAAGTTGAARERGANPLAQLALGLGAGVAVPTAAMGVAGTWRGVRGVGEALSSEGQNRIAARVLQDRATNPRLAADNLANAREIVPGSIPTSGPASRDIGLLAFERGMRSRRADDFGVRTSQQNAARQRALDEIAGDETDIAAAIAAREEGTTAARNAAFEGNPQVDTAPILARADEILAGPTGARREVRRAIEDFREAIAGETDAQRLYGIRQDMGEAMGGRLRNSDRADYALAKRELIQLQRALDEQIEAVAPGFRDYLASYSRLSKPIDQMEVLQELQRQGTTAAPDASTGRDLLSQAGFTRRLDRLLADPQRSRSLTPEQIQVVRAVAEDLDSSAAINASNIRAPGSDTYQNLSSANVVQRVRGGQASVAERSLLRTIDWLFKHSDAVVEDILTEAMLDPALAERLLREPTAANVRALDIGFREAMRRLGFGSAVGSATASGQTEPQ